MSRIQSISTSFPRHHTGKEHKKQNKKNNKKKQQKKTKKKNIRMASSKTTQTESQEASSFPADVPQAILNKINKSSKANRKRINFTIRINYNRSTAFEWSVINNWRGVGGGGRGGGKPVSRSSKPRLDSVVVHKHTSCSVRVKDYYSSMHQNSKNTNQGSTLR